MTSEVVRNRSHAGRRIAVALLVAVALSIVVGLGLFVWKYAWPRAGINLRVAATGPEAGMVRAVGVRGDRLEIEQVDGSGSSRGGETYIPGSAGWRLALIMLPQPGASIPSERAPAHLGWFLDGTPLAARPLRADRISGDDAFGIDAVSLATPAGPFAWQLVPVPPNVVSLSVALLPWNAAPADIAAAVGAATPAQMTDEQALALLELICGDVREFNLLGPAGEEAALRTYADGVVARGRAVAPTLTALAAGSVALFRLDLTQAPAGKAAELRLVPLGPGDAASAEIRARVTWIMAALDPAKYDAAALASLKGSDPLVPIVQTALRAAHLPPGAGAALAERMIAEGAGRSGKLGDNLGHSRSVALIAADLLARPWLAKEAHAFLKTFATGADESVRIELAANVAAHLTRRWPQPGLEAPAPAAVADVLANVARLEPAQLRKYVVSELAFRFPRLLVDDHGDLRRASPPE